MACAAGLFVGDDAHIVPRRDGLFPCPVEWGNVIYDPVHPSHSTRRGSSVRLRDDVGIVPYIFVELRAIQRTFR